MTMNEEAFFSLDIKNTVRDACLPAHLELVEALAGYRRALIALSRASHLEDAWHAFDLIAVQSSVGQLKTLKDAISNRYDRLIDSRNAAAVHESERLLVRKSKLPAPPYVVSDSYTPNKEARALLRMEGGGSVERKAALALHDRPG
ncbi:hypothetical protein [Cohnella hashimotonis]|uniref:Uncharacterized protein n=1 Tax=Cohnella hashimotonis TaxID=2826895 RepID=A0ABT6TEJ1_9BACL|nr:hypothetical protein [Cohnella hashimotonis]MDI4644971.1 hypothetical protein [Cohnella hashimotonis]